MSAVGNVSSLFTTGLMLDFEPFIHQLDPFDAPLQRSVNASGNSVLSTESVFEIKVEWQDETGLTPRSTLAATCATADAFLTLGAGNRLRFQTDDVLLLGNEVVRVTGYGTTAETLTISRAFGGTTAAQAANGSAVIGLGQAALEGADPAAARAVDRAARFNYTQIFTAQVQATGTTRAIRKFGLSGTEFDKQLANRMREKFVEFDQTLVYGVRSLDGATNRRTMGGLDFYITTNVSTATTLTETALLDHLQGIYDRGGNPSTFMVGSKQKRVVSGFTSSGVIQVVRNDGQRGVQVDTFVSDFGQIAVVLNRNIRTADAFTYDRDQATVGVLRPMTFEALAKTGDADKGMVVMEKTLRFRRENHAGKFKSLT